MRLLAAALSLLLWLTASVAAQNSYPTAGGARVPALVVMCVANGIARPCAGTAVGQDSVFPTAGGATVPGRVQMCLTAGLGIPCAGGGGGVTPPAAPTVTGVTPNNGDVAGGTAVSVGGTNLTGATALTFGGTTATIGIVTPTTIATTTPAHAVGAVNVLVTTPGGTGTGTGVFTYTSAGGCAQSTAFLGRTSGLDGTHTTAYTNLICGLVTDGVFSKFDGLWITATQDATTASLNLISTSGTLVPHGSPVFTADRGYVGVDASTTVYLDTQINASTFGGTFTQNAGHISLWSNNNVASPQISMGMSLSSAAASISGIYVNYGDGNSYCAINDNGVFPGVNATGLGHYICNRSDSISLQFYKNGSSFATTGNTSQSLTGLPTTVILANNDSASGVARGSAAQIGAASIGGSLFGGSDASNFYTRLRTYMTAVGAP